MRTKYYKHVFDYKWSKWFGLLIFSEFILTIFASDLANLYIECE